MEEDDEEKRSGLVLILKDHGDCSGCWLSLVFSLLVVRVCSSDTAADISSSSVLQFFMSGLKACRIENICCVRMWSFSGFEERDREECCTQELSHFFKNMRICST